MYQIAHLEDMKRALLLYLVMNLPLARHVLDVLHVLLGNTMTKLTRNHHLFVKIAPVASTALGEVIALDAQQENTTIFLTK